MATDPNPGGRPWFLPFRDSAVKDTPEILAAIKLVKRDTIKGPAS